MVVDAKLAVLDVLSCLAIDFDERKHGAGLAGLHIVEEHHGMFYILDIDATSGGERLGRRNVVIHVVGELNGSRHLLDGGDGIVSRQRERQPQRDH